MGKTSAEFIRANPDRVLVVLAGVQHVASGHGIPARVENALGFPGTIVLSERDRERFPQGGDVFLDTPDAFLPDSGRMGVYIDSTGSGPVIAGFAEDSPAQVAGARKNDVITRVNDREVSDFGDIKRALWRLMPGDPVLLEVRRAENGSIRLSFDLY
jgi:membrane-associated protease RseP (regulator of RpoE activity)